MKLQVGRSKVGHQMAKVTRYSGKYFLPGRKNIGDPEKNPFFRVLRLVFSGMSSEMLRVVSSSHEIA